MLALSIVMLTAAPFATTIRLDVEAPVMITSPDTVYVLLLNAQPAPLAGGFAKERSMMLSSAAFTEIDMSGTAHISIKAARNNEKSLRILFFCMFVDTSIILSNVLV